MPIASRLYAALSMKTPPFPGRLQIETTNRCNAACAMCPILTMERPKGTMDFALFDRICQELAGMPPLRRIILHIMGEPMLNPDLTAMIRHLKKVAPHQPVDFSTNGSLLDAASAREVIESGVEAVNFSIDALNPETHAKIRKGLNFQKVMANLESFIELMAASGKTKPRILIQLIKMDLNRDEWQAFAELWQAKAAEHEFLTVYIKELWSWGGYLESGQAEKERAEGSLALPCGYPFDQLDVYWDGRVGFCCLDEDIDLQVGDVNSQSLAGIWQSAELERIRAKFKRFDFSGLRCATCGERLRYRKWSQVGGRAKKALGLGS